MMSVLTRSVFSNSFRNPKNCILSLRFSPKGGQRRPKSKLNSYVLTKYVRVVKVFEDNLQKYFPKGAKFYEVFSVGLKYFRKDCKIFFTAFKKVKSGEQASLSRKELEVYYQMPKEMIRAAPVLIVGAGIPFGGFALIVGYYFPRQLLTYHFWSLQQRSEFALISHKKRLEYYKPIIRSMESDLKNLKDNPLCNKMCEVLESLKNGKQPDIDLILSCKKLFEEFPYGLKHLSSHHIIGLLKIYNMHRGWRRLRRLETNAMYIKLMDVAIVREGGLQQLTQDELIWNSFVRGINPIDMQQEDILNWMTSWLAVSEKVDEKSYSLLLHCPILLGYSHFSNWKLLNNK